MKIVSKTDLRVATLWGAVVNLKANEVREVGEKLGIYALQMGARQVGAEPVVEPEVVSEIPEEIVEEGLDPKLIEVLEGLMTEGNPDNFKVDGSPKAAVLNKKMARTISAEERNTAWEVVLNA